MITAKHMSRYNPYFVEPVVTKEEQSRLKESGELAKLGHVSIKAAANFQTSSVFFDPIVRKLINHIMEDGKKELARSLLEKGFLNIKRIQVQRYNSAKTDEERAEIETSPLKLLHRAIENARPLLKLTPIKRGGITYQVPVPISEKHSYFFAYNWLLEATNQKERTVHFPEKFAWEVIDAAHNTGKVIKRKTDLHQQCEANRAYAHYRWI